MSLFNLLPETCLLQLFIAITAAAYVGNVGGGHAGAIRRKSVISAASTEPPADIKCQFSGITGACRQSFQRKYAITENGL